MSALEAKQDAESGHLTINAVARFFKIRRNMLGVLVLTSYLRTIKVKTPTPHVRITHLGNKVVTTMLTRVRWIDILAFMVQHRMYVDQEIITSAQLNIDLLDFDDGIKRTENAREEGNIPVLTKAAKTYYNLLCNNAQQSNAAFPPKRFRAYMMQGPEVNVIACINSLIMESVIADARRHLAIKQAAKQKEARINQKGMATNAS